MIGPAEFEDIRLDLADAERERRHDAALAALDRYQATGGMASVEVVSRIRNLVVVPAAGRSAPDWKGLVSDAAGEAGYRVRWNGDEVAALEPDARACDSRFGETAASR